MSKYWLIFGLLFLFLLPSTVFASRGIYEIYDVDPVSGDTNPDSFQYAQYEGLVPCGKEISLSYSLDVDGNLTGYIQQVLVPCEFCHLFVMLNRLIHFALSELVPLLSIGMLVIAGIMFFFAQGNTNRLGKAKQLFTGVVLGLAIIYGAWLIVSGLLSLVGATEWTGLQGEWFKFDCPVRYPEDYIAPPPGGFIDPEVTFPDGHWVPCSPNEENCGSCIGDITSMTFYGLQTRAFTYTSKSCPDGEVAVAGRCLPGRCGEPDDLDLTSTPNGYPDPNDDQRWKCKFYKKGGWGLGASVSGRVFRYCTPPTP
jgi:hypothetical protein